MSIYAVIDPATGRPSRNTPDHRRRPARGDRARRNEAHRKLVRIVERGGSRGARAASGRACTRAARGARANHRAGDGKPIEQALGEVDFCGGHLRLLRRQRRGADGRPADQVLAARGRPSCGGAHSASCSGSCRGTSRTTRWPVRGAQPRIGNTIVPRTRRSVRARRAAIQQISPTPGSPKAHTRTSTRRTSRSRWVIADPRIRGGLRHGFERACRGCGDRRRNLRRSCWRWAVRSLHPARTDDLDKTVEDAVAPGSTTPASRCNAPSAHRGRRLYEPFLEKFTAG